ncbi:MAG: hypothetical protein WD073_03170 [Xanthobacteraceae bacterium]
MRAYLTRAKQTWLRPRRFEELVRFDWPRSLALILGGLVVSFFLFGFWWPYWRHADMDFWMVYEGFLYNDNLPQEYFDHPGYLTILAIGAWFRFLHGIGLLDVNALSALPAPAEAHDAWTHAVRAGRLLSLLLAVSFVTAFGFLLRRLIGDWRIAVLGTFALTFSGGLMMQARIMRTELISAGLVTISLLMFLIAARSPRLAWRPLLVGAGAFLATLGYVNKVQVIVLICALPLVVLAFGTRSDESGGFWRTSPLALPLAALSAAAAALAAIPAAALVELGLSDMAMQIFSWRPLPLGLSGLYQPLIAGWIVLAMLIFAAIWRVSLSETLVAIAAVVAGVALGLLSLKLRYDPKNVLVALNPLEQLLSFAVINQSSCLGLAPKGGLICSLIEGIGDVIARRTFVLHTSSRPTIFLEWFVLAAAFVTWRRGERGLAGTAAVVMLVVWGVDTIGTLRGLKNEYFLYTDPLVIVAAAMLLSQFADLRRHRWVFQAGVLLFLIHVFLSLAEPVKHTLMRRQPTIFCQPHMHYTKRIVSYSYCPAEIRDRAPAQSN